MAILGICPPAQFYLILSVFFLIGGVFYKFSIITLIFKVVFIGLWTWFLNWLCKKDLNVMSWILAFVPFLVVILSVLVAVDIMSVILAAKIMNQGAPSSF